MQKYIGRIYIGEGFLPEERRGSEGVGWLQTGLVIFKIGKKAGNSCKGLPRMGA